MLKIVILGENGPYPAPGGATTGILVQTEEGSFVIDLGSGVLSQLLRHLSLDQLSAVILTHHHHDHTADVGVLKYAIMSERARGRRRTPLTVYANREPKEDFARIHFPPHLLAEPLTPSSQLQLCGARVTFAAVKHALPCLAVAVEKEGKKFVFSADTGPCPEIVQLAEGADLFLCEASWLVKDEGAPEIGHLTTWQAAEIAREAQVKDLCLTHLYPGYDREEIRQEGTAYFGGPVHIAKQDMSFLLA